MKTNSVSERLEHEILSGVFMPGQPLSQSELAQRYGVSRIPIRDALSQLSKSGLVHVRPNRTAHVIEMTKTELIEVFDLRLMLECDLIQRSIPLVTPTHMADIKYALERSNLEARNANWSKGDEMFHAALYAPAGRPRQCAIVRDSRRACRVHIAAYDVLTEATPKWLSDHESIVEGYAAGNISDTQAHLAKHITSARDALLGAMST